MPNSNINALKICLIIDSLANGGAQRQIVNLAVGLKERGHEVHLVTYAPHFHHLEKLLAAGIKHYHFEKKNKLDPRPVLALRKLISESAIDVLIAFLRTPVIYAEIAGIAKPSLTVVASERGGVKPGGLQLFDLFSGLLHSLSDAVISNSYAYSDALSSKLPFLKRKSLTIQNGIDEIFFRQGKNRITSDPQSQSAFQTLCVVAARPTPEKGLMQLLQAVKLLREKGYTDFKIDWIGPADTHYPLIIEAKEFLANNNLERHWKWIGSKSNIETIYQHYDAHILPSLHEGVANVLCEAMACGVPSIATKIADNSDIVIDRVTGILCEPDDPISLSNSLEIFMKMSQTEKQIMSRKAHVQAETLFSMTRFLDNWESAVIANIKQSSSTPRK